MTNEVTEDIKELVIKRLESMPSNKKLSIGEYGEFNREQLVDHVRTEDEIGQKIVEVEMEFLKTFKKGLIRWKNI